MRKKVLKGLFLVSVCIGLIGIFTGCSDDDTYRDTLKSGLEKYYSGEKMDEKEYNAVKSFNKWKEKQGEKSYDDWDDQVNRTCSGLYGWSMFFLYKYVWHM